MQKGIRLMRVKVIKFNRQRVGRFSIVSVEDLIGRKGVGIARLSDKDKDISDLGMQIAEGRALKALYMKTVGIKVNGHFVLYG